MANKFDVPEGYGATSVRNFVAETEFSTGVPPISGSKTLSGKSTPGCELSALEADVAVYDAVIPTRISNRGKTGLLSGTMFACRKK